MNQSFLHFTVLVLWVMHFYESGIHLASLPPVNHCCLCSVYSVLLLGDTNSIWLMCFIFVFYHDFFKAGARGVGLILRMKVDHGLWMMNSMQHSSSNS